MKEVPESKLIHSFTTDKKNDLIQEKCTCRTVNNKRKADTDLCNYCVHNLTTISVKSKAEVLPFSIKYLLYDMLGASILVRVIRSNITSNKNGKFNHAGDSIIRINKEYKGTD